MSANYWANQFEKKDEKNHKEWYELFNNAIKNLETYANQHYANGLLFGNQQSESWNLLIEDRFVETAPPIIPRQEVKVSEEKGKQVVPAKAPKKEVKGQMCEVMNFEDDKVELGASEIKMMTGIFFENCRRTHLKICLLYTSPSPRDQRGSRMPSSA